MSLPMWSAFFLTVTAILSAVGLVSAVYKDNLFQCVGMFGLMIGCSSRIVDVWTRTSIPFDWFLIHAGMGMFAIGVFWKVFTYERRQKFANYIRDAGGTFRDRFASNADVSHAWRQFEEGRLEEIPIERRQGRRTH